MSAIKFKATKVFHEIWAAINLTFINSKGLKQRRYRLIEEVGGTRSSKTWSNFQILFLYGYNNPLKNMVVMRDTAVDCRDKVETDWIKWLRDPNARSKEYEDGKITVEELDRFLKEEELTKYFINNKSLHTWTFIHNNTFITFTGTDDENRSIGKTQNVLWVNEPYMFSEEVFIQLTQRTSDFIIVDWNPKQNHFIERQRLKDDTFSHRSTLLDNPFCPLESRKQTLGYQPLKHAEVVRSELITEGEAYGYDLDENILQFTVKQIRELRRCIKNEREKTASEYHYFVYMLGEKSEKPNRIFRNWVSMPLAEFDTLPYSSFYGLDFGLSSPTAVVEMKFDGDCTFFFKERLYKPMNLMQGTLSEELMNIGIDKKLQLIVDSGNELNKLEGINLMNNGFNIVFATKGKGSVLSGIETLQKKKVYYAENSKNIIAEYENHSWRVLQGIQLDEPEQGNDHIIDAMKYVAVWYCMSYGIK